MLTQMLTYFSLKSKKYVFATVGVLLTVAGNTGAASNARYQTPARAIVDMIDAPLIPQTALSPTRDWLMLQERPALPSIGELAQPELRLAGQRINPRNNDQSRKGTSTAIKLVKIADQSEKTITGLPPEAKIGDARWSPDGRRIAFSVVKENSVDLYIAEASNGVLYILFTLCIMQSMKLTPTLMQR